MTKSTNNNTTGTTMKKLLIAAIPMIMTSCLTLPTENTDQAKESVTKIDTVYSHSTDTVFSQEYDTTFAVQEFYSTDTTILHSFDTTFVIDTIHMIDSWSMKTEIYDLDAVINKSTDTVLTVKFCKEKHRAIRNRQTGEIIKDSELDKCKLL